MENSSFVLGLGRYSFKVQDLGVLEVKALYFRV